MKVDLSRPDLSYALIWGGVYCLSRYVTVDYSHEFPVEISSLILFNIISFFFVYQFVKWLLSKQREIQPRIRLTDSDLIYLKDFCRILLGIWIPFYLLTIVTSGGWPVYWVLTGDERTYVDFGVPTLSGLLYMIRAFMFTLYALFYLESRNKKYLFIPFLLILTALGEVSRGGLTVLLLQGLGIYLFHKKSSIRQILLVATGAIFFILLFGWMADFRGAHVSIEELAGEESIFSSLPSGFFWVYTYVTTPINNVNYAYTMGIEPLYYPYFSIQSVIPSIFRDYLFQDTPYPIALAVDAFNATSFYSPLLADFGIFGAALMVLILQIVVSYVHINALKGKLFHILVFPVLYMCIVLSVFYMFFFSLITLMYPILAYFCVSYVQSRRSAQSGEKFSIN